MASIQIDQTKCIRCGMCTTVCTRNIFVPGDPITIQHNHRCFQCGQCVAACPTDAVQHAVFPLDDCPEIDSRPTLETLVNTFRARRSVRVYQEQPIDRETIAQLVDIARWVPSASNKQHVDWWICDDPEQIATLSARFVSFFSMAARLIRFPLLKPLWKLVLGRQANSLATSAEYMQKQHAQGQDPILFDAPVLLIAHTPKRPFSRDDAVYATYNLMLAADQLGLGTCQIGFFKLALSLDAKLRRMIDLPKGRRAEVTLVLGYPKPKFRRAVSRRQPNITWKEPQSTN